MAKKKEEVVEEVVVVSKISKVSEDFGRHDLNLLRDKLNEIIDAL